MKVEKLNATAQLYQGEFQCFVECPSSGRCRHARFYVEPPEDGDTCIWATGCQGCGNKRAHIDAIEALRKHLEAAAKQAAEELEGGE